MNDLQARLAALTPQKRTLLALQLSQQAFNLPTEESSASTHRLIASVTTKQKQPLTAGELRSFLQQHLPDYMMPSAYVVVDEFPLSPNGKIDRRALATEMSHQLRNKSQRSLENGFVAPRDFIERHLAQIWSEILDVAPISIWDNFFDLGGHSLLALRLVAQIQQQLSTLYPESPDVSNLQVSIKLLFQHPTIAELAAALNQLLTPVRSFDSQSSSSHGKNSRAILSPKTKEPSPFVTLEPRSLLSLLAVGKLAPVDSAALSYIPLSLLKETTLTRQQIRQDWFDNLPLWNTLMETEWGRIAILTLPMFEDELYSNPQKLVQGVVDALLMSRQLGAKTVSLTGLIPSATDYGHTIVNAIEGLDNLPKITTGHATTCATVVLSIKKILQVSQRCLEQEKVAFIGLGSVGMSTLRLMLKTLPHPKSIILCDVYSKLELIERVQQELSAVHRFQGEIQIAASTSELPPEIYDASLIVGATNVPDILDIQRLEPNTLIVDDSAPHCFSSEEAIERFEKQNDILFTEGGVLKAPHPIKTTFYLPEPIKNTVSERLWESYSNPGNPHNITGCVLSSILSSRFDEMVHTIGLLNWEMCVQHYQGLERLGLQSADLHCEGYVLPVIR
jgi:predicted amino acid dehydrogenase